MADKCINSNPDIAGIGIRFNFYITILVGIFTREKKYTEELLSGVYKNSVINGLSLLITTLIANAQGKMDLYHAIILTYILLFFNIVFLFGERRFVWSSRDPQMFIYLLIHAGCTVIFVMATAAWFRFMMLIFFAAAIPVIVLLLGFLIIAPYNYPERMEACTDALQSVFKKYHTLWLIRYVISFPIAVYVIVNLELIICRNRSIIQPGENEWGFGQIIAVILTLGIFIDLVWAFRQRHSIKYHPLENSEDKLTS